MVSEVDTRTRILVEGSALIRELGLPGLSMRKLAARVNLSATALYRHFDNKEALIVAICVEGFERFGQTLWQALSAPTAWERLEQAGVQYRRFALQNPNFYRVMFLNYCEPLVKAEVSEADQRRFGATFVFLVDRVEECMAAGLLARSSAETVATSFWAHCHGLVALRLDGLLAQLDEDQFESFYDSSCAALRQGLKTVQ